MLTALGACVLAAMFASPSPAAATERVSDGSFEGSDCQTNGCTNSSWTWDGLATAQTLIGPFCGEVATLTECGAPADAAHGGSNWARLGAGEGPASIPNQAVVDWIQQDVLVPPSTVPGQSPTLSFWLRIIDDPLSSGNLTVTLGGQQVLFVDDQFVGFPLYARVSIDLSSVAKPSRQTLKFEGVSSFPPVADTGTAHSDSYDIDDVSIATPDPSSGSPPTSGTGPTGQRAAALKKCKRKHSKMARKKCRRKAQLLPV